MKKVFALILAIALMASLSVTAFAVVDQDSTDPKGSTNVYFEVDPTYTITIPATVELRKVENEGTVTYENDYTITASENLRLRYDEYITVTVTDGFLLNTKEGATLSYEMTVDGDEIETGDVVAQFDTSVEEQSVTMHLVADDPDYAGRYEGTLTFNIAVVESEVG